MSINEILHEALLVGINKTHRLFYRSVKRGIGIDVDVFRCNLCAMVHAFDDNTAAVFLREAQIGLCQGRCLDIAVHQRIVAGRRSVWRSASLDHVTRQKSLKHLKVR